MKRSTLTVENVTEESAVVLMNGYKVRLHFATHSPENTLSNVRNLLLNSLTQLSAYEKRADVSGLDGANVR